MKKQLKYCFFSLFVSLSSILSSCGSTTFVLANFESYISPLLLERVQEKHPLTFLTYPSNEKLINGFANNTYSVAVASTYAVSELIERDLLSPIDWSQFNLKKSSSSSDKVNNASDAKDLFIDSIKEISQQTKDSKNNELLHWAVPYFLQNLVFVYRGEKISELEQENVSWTDVIKAIVKHKDRFNDNRLVFIDDARTIFSLANIVNTNNNSTDVNPKENGIGYFTNVYESFQRLGLTKSNLDSIFVNSDSNIVINELASGRRQGGIVYNGDAVYAALGGDLRDELSEEQIPDGNNFHIVQPKISPVALDLLVINKQQPNFQKEAHEIIFDLALDGADQTKEQLIKTDEELGTDDEDFYLKGAMQNFSYVNYVSPLKVISDPSTGIVNSKRNNAEMKSKQMSTDQMTSEKEFDYYTETLKALLEKKDSEELNENEKKLVETIKKAYTIEKDSSIQWNQLVEKPISPLQRSNLSLSWLDFKLHWW
ncbi:type 2 periplasmic-binding domain-containing protein [Mycoplasmoides genitalium]|uniref:hypothetical protein n=1 Tax=Mycoplasmoides genitalium TaxID=2097 RepID=UPI00027B3646|nr:hypothetical protein [Mycoplasmoides genitalium]AFQ03347.1 spermidine/putrescine ABC transporter spermidine/putrescine binding protein [Mycoplasmoides genitalium M6282]